MSCPLPGETPYLMSSREFDMGEEMRREIEMTDRFDDYDVLSLANTSDNYRDERKETLFVRRAPHLVRAPTDTGVEYEIKEANQECKLTLNNPTHRSEYDWTSVQLNTGRLICQACHDVFNYYCKYIEAKLKVSDLPGIFIFRQTK